MKDWWIYRGDGQPRNDWRLPEPPSWRAFANQICDEDDGSKRRISERSRGATYQIDQRAIDIVNAAMLLRRPLLVTGEPGSGKTSLAFAVAHELDLGPVLYWPINSRSTLREGLYNYDAIGRMQETSIRQAWASDGADAERRDEAQKHADPPDIGPYITLGSLGTALLPAERPRVLLIDEVDKGDIDLPNDLLNVFEEGRFVVPELARVAERSPEVEVRTADPDGRAVIIEGRVQCREFPFVVLTSNGERDFPPPFLRRCLQVTLQRPDGDKLARIVEAHLGPQVRRDAEELIEEFLRRRDRSLIATDQLLNAVYLLVTGTRKDPTDREELLDVLLQSLGGVRSG